MITPEDYQKMQKGICPICNEKMLKSNGQRTHSKTKSAICEARFREKCKVPHDIQKINVDGKIYEVDANYQKR